ncbi:UNVERIFIED_ORG: hypothetical protein BCL66_102188 [Martelella mediterranea]
MKRLTHPSEIGLFQLKEWLAFRFKYTGRARAGYAGEEPKRKLVEKKRKRLLSHDKRKAAVGRLATILDGYYLSKFQYEASCRHGVRSALCLQGYGWADADAEAALLVEEALKTIGAKRPRWEEGQKYYSVSKDYCARCGGSMDGAHGRFCSVECARATLNDRAGSDKRHQDRVIVAAQRMITRHNHAPIECAQCGKTFHPLNAKVRFCSAACLGASVKIHHEKPCAVCGTVFQPRYQGHRCCSMDCSGKLSSMVRAEKLADLNRHCKECGTEFTPKVKTAIYCSEVCRKKAGIKREAEKRQASAKEPFFQVRTCPMCNSEFTATNPRAIHCSKTCNARAYKMRQRARKKALADPGIIRLPVPEKVPMTKELFDSWFMAA